MPKPRGMVTLDVAVTLAVVTAAFATMLIPIQRSIQHKLLKDSESIGDQLDIRDDFTSDKELRVSSVIERAALDPMPHARMINPPPHALAGSQYTSVALTSTYTGPVPRAPIAWSPLLENIQRSWEESYSQTDLR